MTVFTESTIQTHSPDGKHNRIPAPEMSFTRPNLPFLIGEIEALH